MCTLLSFAQPVLGASLNHFNLVSDPVRQERFETQSPRNTVNQRQHVCTEVVLQLGVLVQLVQHNLCHSIALEFNNQAHAGA